MSQTPSIVGTDANDCAFCSQTPFVVLTKIIMLLPPFEVRMTNRAFFDISNKAIHVLHLAKIHYMNYNA